MTERTRIELRITRDLKEAAEAACAERGTTLSEEIRAFLAIIAKRANK